MIIKRMARLIREEVRHLRLEQVFVNEERLGKANEVLGKLRAYATRIS